MNFTKKIAKFLLLSILFSALNLQIYAPKAYAQNNIEVRSIQNIDRSY